MDKEKSINVLNTIIEINNDRIEGYETASKETEETDLKTMFSKFSQTSQKCKTELVNEVQNLGGKPIEGTKTTGKFFRVWMDVKVALTRYDRKAILNSCEFGEDHAVDTYNKILKDDADLLTSDQQKMVKAQQALIKADHDEVKKMRDLVAEHN